jgi:hypothetical protein
VAQQFLHGIRTPQYVYVWIGSVSQFNAGFMERVVLKRIFLEEREFNGKHALFINVRGA